MRGLWLWGFLCYFCILSCFFLSLSLFLFVWDIQYEGILLEITTLSIVYLTGSAVL